MMRIWTRRTWSGRKLAGYYCTVTDENNRELYRTKTCRTQGAACQEARQWVKENK